MTEKGVAFETVNYIEEPLPTQSLRNVLRSAGLKPSELLRTKEAAYREYVAGKNLSEEQLLDVMAKHPELIQRPLVVRGNKAVLARPVENLKKLDL